MPLEVSSSIRLQPSRVPPVLSRWAALTDKILTMRILIINQPYWPDVVATAQHMADWARELSARGHEVTVIASRSVYGQQGAVLPKEETHQGVHIRRVGSNLFRKGRILTRLIDFGMFHLLALWTALTMTGSGPDTILLRG